MNPGTRKYIDPIKRCRATFGRVVCTAKVNLHSFSIGEHYQEEFLDSANTVILGEAATITKNIRLGVRFELLNYAHLFEEKLEL